MCLPCQRCCVGRPLIVMCPDHLFTAKFDEKGALAWRSKNFAVRKAINKAGYYQGNAEVAYEICMTTCDLGMASFCQFCAVPMILKILLMAVILAMTLAVDISEHLYAEIVDNQDADAVEEIGSVVYQNVKTIHGNIMATFRKLGQVSDMLGLVKAKTDRLPNRRLEVTDCISTTLGYVNNCSKPSCETPTRFCDGSFNYEYISQLEGGENHN